ncbi:hypothetical protein [Pedobacter flavus]|uniref:Uncharacterized protein n=1 Tax=Pedobacter flavus TaxID=3113906 RepID=A0ABU7H573_9SPHI|nr:hypothetical protein [Pedobacter sp. VNH31]MEE1885706.1 hypothetical protein [Pedobacter sp. VNH31]
MLRIIIALLLGLAATSSSNNVGTYNAEPDPIDSTGYTGGDNGNIPPPRPPKP